MADDTKPECVGVIIATHGGLAASLIGTVEQLLAGECGLSGAGLEAGDAPPRYSKKLQALVRRTNQGAGVIILVDLFGGTPGNVALSLAEPGRVEVITGVNLPMALTAAELPPGLSLAEASQRIVEAGKASLKSAGNLLRGR